MKRAALLLCISVIGTQGYAVRALHLQDGQRAAAPREARPAGGKAPAAKGTPPRERAPAVEISPDRVIEVLRSVAGESKDWKNAAASASVRAQIADLLWDEDAHSARAYLVEAWEASTLVEDAAAQRSAYRNSSPRTSSRREVISVARERAPDLAEKWLEEMARDNATREGGAASRRGAFDDRTQRSALLLQLALSGVEDDPQAAAELAVESLKDGISFGLHHVLLKLQEKKFELAERVFSAALVRLRAVGMVDPNELLILHAYLYTPGRVSAANTTDNPGQSQLSRGRNQPTVRAAAEIKPALGLEFLRVAADLLINAPLPSATENPQLTARTQISVFNVLRPKMSQALPEQTLALQIRAQQMQADAQFTPGPQPVRADSVRPIDGEGGRDYARRRIDRLEELAGKETDPLRRDIAYAKAALATAAEEHGRGVALAEKIRDDALRVQMADWLYSRASLHFAQAGKPNEAYELLRKVNDPSQGAICLVVGAQKLVKAKDTTRARQWLQEARALIEDAEPDDASAGVALGVVSTYAAFDSVVALEALGDAVKLINHSPNTSPASERAPAVKRFSGFAEADYTYGTSGFGLHAAVAAFNQTSFEGVLDSLRKITNVELRAGAIVALCRKNFSSARLSHK